MSEERPIYHQPAAPDADAVLNDPAVSFWLKDALRSALLRDPVDAANDAAVLSALLASRWAALLDKGRGTGLP